MVPGLSESYIFGMISGEPLRMPSTLVSLLPFEAVWRAEDNGQEQLKQERKNTVGPGWKLVCEHLKSAGSVLDHCRDTIHILLKVNLSCAPGSEIHPGFSVNHTPWNWAV